MNETDLYISKFPGDVREIMEKIRAIIKDKAPDAIENIAYGMPGYKTHGRPLVYFAGYKNHVGFYATLAGHIEFAEELSKFKQGKGSVQFQINEPVPYDLIARIVEFRVKENILRAVPKKSSRK
jgi:uncharacterized protein YdhG (YjbR/CyaY superfamily)